MNILLLILAALLCFKVLSVPYDLAIRSLKKDKQDNSGISLSLEIEIILWLLLVVAAFVSRGESWLDNPKHVALWGFVAIIDSYVHFFVAGAIADG
jgi:ACR3 family arsenite efflux pump ArsB